MKLEYICPLILSKRQRYEPRKGRNSYPIRYCRGGWSRGSGLAHPCASEKYYQEVGGPSGEVVRNVKWHHSKSDVA